MFRCLSGYVAFGFLSLIYLSPVTADIVVTGTTRGVAAAATGDAGSGDMTLLPGTYIKDAMSLGTSPAGTVISSAHQGSTVPSFIAPTMKGIGTADVFASATGFTGFSNFAESYLDVFFDVTTTGFYSLDATVVWTGAGPPPYGGFAKVELLDISGATLIDSVTSTPGSPGTHTLSDSYLLIAGAHYRLVAEVEIGGGFATAGEYTSFGSWSFTLAVPEPGSFMLLSCGLVIFVGIRRQKISRC